MSEGSAYWEGSATGDAGTSPVWDAPYTHSEWSSIKNYLLANSGDGGFVVPGYNNNLAVAASAPAAMTVEVATGAMFTQGRIYENTANKVLDISANSSGFTRIDRIVIRTTYAAQTIRVMVVAGTPAASPVLPVLERDSTYYDVPIAYIWVANGAASIDNTNIHDERLFASNSYGLNVSQSHENLVKNSEFMAFSQLSGGATTNPPECWDLVGTPFDIASYTRPYQMVRGRAVSITTDGVLEGISQTIPAKPSTQYVVKLLTRVTPGDIGVISVTTNSAAPDTITRHTNLSTSWVEETIFYMTEDDASTLSINLLTSASGEVVTYGQVLLVEGYIPGPFRKSHEKLEFTEAVTDWSWTDNAYTNTTYTIDLTTAFQGIILEETRGVLIQLSGYDLVAATSTCYVGSTGGVQTSINTTNVAENVTQYSTAWVGLQTMLGTYCHTISAQYYSNPPYSLYITIVILGIIT